MRLYGLGNCRILLVVKLLRKRWFMLLQGFLSTIYILLVITAFIGHDVWFLEISERAVSNIDDAGVVKGTRIMLTAEAALLCMFVLDVSLNTLGYGCLYLQHLAGFELVLILANAGLIFALSQEKALFAVKLLMSVCLVAIRIMLIKTNMTVLKHDLQRI